MSAAKLTTKELEWAFTRIPQLSASRPDDFRISSLPGYSNRNFRLYNDRCDWVLRLPRAQTNRLIDRAAEAHNQALAHQLGVAPDVAWRDDNGATLTATLRGSRPLSADDLTDDAGLARALEPLQQLHRSGLQFIGGRGLRDTLRQHYELLPASQRPRFAARWAQAERVLSLLDCEQLDAVPSHRDPVLSNLLLNPQRLWLIDWEYSAMAAPYWDLAILCNEAELDLAQSRRLLNAYCVGGPRMKESTLFDFRGLLKLLNDCWMAALAAG